MAALAQERGGAHERRCARVGGGRGPRRRAGDGAGDGVLDLGWRRGGADGDDALGVTGIGRRQLVARCAARRRSRRELAVGAAESSARSAVSRASRCGRTAQLEDGFVAKGGERSHGDSPSLFDGGRRSLSTLALTAPPAARRAGRRRPARRGSSRCSCSPADDARGRPSRDEVADRAVGAHALTMRGECLLQVVPEAPQHLELDVLRRAAEQPVDGDRMRHGAQVVRGDRDPDARARLEQYGRERLEVAVGLRLDLEDRRVPAVLPGLDDLVIPVRALDEADVSGSGPLVRRGPGEDPVEQRGGVAQVGLQHEPGGGPVAELLLGEQLEHEVGDRLARVEGLHVDVQVCIELAGAAQQAAQPHRGVALAEVRRVRAQQRRERRDLHREVHARRGTRAVALEQRARRQRGVDGGEVVERRRAACRVAVGLVGGDRRLAEQVDRGGHAVLPEAAQHAVSVPRRLADDEAVRHPPHACGGRRAEGRAPGARVAHPHRDADRLRWVLDVVQEAGQVTREVVERAARGDDVDEAKERGTQLGVLGGEVHRPVVQCAHRPARALRAVRPRARRRPAGPPLRQRPHPQTRRYPATYTRAS